MGATASAQRDARSPDHAPALGQEVNELLEGENLDDKVLQKNGQISISSLSRKSDDLTDIHSEDNTLAEVGQTDAVPQKDEVLETMETAENEESPQVNGETEEGKSADATMVTEDKAAEDTSTETSEVGFKKIFRFVGFKFTLKKDKNEKAEPVKLLTVEKKEEDREAATADAANADTGGQAQEAPASGEAVATEEEETSKAETAPETETPAATEPEAEKVEAPAETPAEGAVEEGTSEKEAEPAAESATSPAAQETQSPFKRFFTQGIFSNLRKKTSFKKAKEEESAKDAPAGEEIKEEESAKDAPAGEEIQETEEKAEEVDASTTEAASEGQAEEAEKAEVAEAQAEAEPAEQTAEQEVAEEKAVPEAAASSSEGPEEQQQEAEEEVAVPAQPALITGAEEAPAAVQPTQKEAEETPEDQAAAPEAAAPEAAAPEAAPEAEFISSQEKAKAQGSPLKKLFTGAGLKKLSSKKPKAKKETKLTESGEQLQTSTESTEGQKRDSGPSSPEESGEHVVSEVTPTELGQEAEASTSDSEKKRDGILSSFKKLVTPKKRVKRSSESEDEGPAGDKPKSATLSSTESAASAGQAEEPKPTEPEPEPTTEPKAEEESAEPATEPATEPKAEEESAEPAEEHQAEESSEVKEETKESKTEPKSEKVDPTTEEPKKKMDTSMSWEALICVGTAKKRARKTSDSEDEDTKLEEDVLQSVEEQAKTTDSPLGTSQEADNENLASSPEPEGELVSTWESFKRLVTSRKKKSDDKAEDTSGAEQTLSDSEIPKEESSFSLRKLIPRRKKKSDGKQGPVSSDVGSAEEDSDTPAVVPLSEYDNEPAESTAEEPKDGKPEESQPEAAEAAVSVQATAAEDRSPSWISAAVDDLEEDAKQLSDIPEELDTAGTPKSTDNTIAEDIVELTSEAVTALEQPPEPSAAEETEMVSAVSRISASPATSGEATPVAEVAEKVETVLQEALEAIVPAARMVTVSGDHQEVATATTGSPQSKSADIEEKGIPVPHQSQEATSICTGLNAMPLEGAEVETPVPAVEGVSAVAEVIATEMAVEEKTKQPEEAGATEDKVYEAEVQEVHAEKTRCLAENTVEETPQTEEVRDAPEAQLAAETEETRAVKVAVVSTPQAEAERLEEPLVEEKPPEEEPEGPAEPTVEEDVCSQTVEVTELAVAEDVQVKQLDDADESVAKAELAPAEEVAEATTEEVTTSLSDTPAVEVSEGTEAPIAVVAATEEFAVTKETVCVIGSPSETAYTLTAEIKDEVIMENVAVAEPSGDEAIQVQVEKEVAAVSAAATVEASVEAVSAEKSVVVEETGEEVEEVPMPTQVDQTKVEVIEEQSSVIVQTIIQNVMENISEMSKDAVGEEEQEAPETSTESAVVAETTPEMSAEPEVKAVQNVTDAAEKAPKTIVQAVQITEVLPVSLPISIAPVQEEVAVMTVDGIDLSMEVPQKDQQLEEQLTGSVEEQKAEVEEKMEEEEKAEVEEKMEEEEKAEVKEVEEKGTNGQSKVEAEPEQVTQEEPSPAESSETAPEVSMVTSGQEELKAPEASSDGTAATEDSEAHNQDMQSPADVPASGPSPNGDPKEEEPAADATATDATATDATTADTIAADATATDPTATDTTTADTTPTDATTADATTADATATDAPAEITTSQSETPAPAQTEHKPDNTVNAQEVLEHVLEEAVKEIEPVSTEIATIS